VLICTLGVADFVMLLSKKIDGKLPSLFGTLPRCPYTIEPVPENQAPSEAAGFYIGSDAAVCRERERERARESSARNLVYSHEGTIEQCTRPGAFFVNTYDLPSRPRYGMYSLTLHEAMPGHHLQTALQAELPNLPLFRVYGDWTAFSEGWGLYSESLGVDMGIYDSDAANFGRLDDEMLRACRLVVDTGIHMFNWTKTQSVEFILSNSALSELEVVSEVERYIGWPGQALAYKSGQLKISSLKSLARKQLGSRFDIRQFHDVVLGNGAIPLEILDQQVLAWVQASTPSTNKA